MNPAGSDSLNDSSGAGARRDAEAAAAAPPADPREPAERRRRRSTATIVTGFSLLVGVMLVQGWLIWQSHMLIGTVQEGRALQKAAADVFDSLLDAESGQRGYLLTADPSFLDGYSVAADRLPGQLGQLRAQAASMSETIVPELVGRIIDLAEQKRRELAETVRLADAGRRDQALALVRTRSGQNAMNLIRSDSALLQDSLEGPIAEKRLALDALQFWLMMGMLAAIAVATALAVVLIRDSRRQLHMLQRREDALRSLASGLERRVAQRTRSLAEANLRFHAALRASDVTVFTQDCELRYSWASKDVLGLAPESLVGRTDREILVEEPQALAIALPAKQTVLRTGEPARVEISAAIDGARRWFDITIDAQRDADGQVVGVVCASVDITDQKERESRIRLLMRELTHRSKNLLTVIDSIARQTAANSNGLKDFLARFRDRLHSLAGSHDQLVQEDWQGAWLRQLVESQLGHYYDPDSPAVTVIGPRLRVGPDAAQHIGLALHELATNAAKYGALSVPEGRVHITWDVEQDTDGTPVCRMVWLESGGPRVQRPVKRGFGQVVIERTVARALGGRVTLEFAPEGLQWILVFPADRITAMPNDQAA
jgi:PAS domain S-box-containing protein